MSRLLFSQEHPERISLLFVGDLMQHKGQIDAARTQTGAYDYSDCFTHVKDELSKADIAIANLEVTIAGKPYSGYPMFGAPDEYLYAIGEAGFDLLLTANNHCLDRRKKGLERTIQKIDSLGLLRAGTYINNEDRVNKYPLLVEKNNFRIVFLNYTYGTNGMSVESPNVVNLLDKELMEEDIRKARIMRPDAIIACVHWGIEYKTLPDRAQKEMADWLISKGVTHVIGGHPHVIQPMEIRQSTHSLDRHVVVYSLGNFISNMSARNTDGGAMLKLELTKRNGIVRISQCAYSLVWTSRPNISGKKNYILYPVANTKDDLNAREANLLNTFAKSARNLLDEHNNGIDEYFFE